MGQIFVSSISFHLELIYIQTFFFLLHIKLHNTVCTETNVFWLDISVSKPCLYSTMNNCTIVFCSILLHFSRESENLWTCQIAVGICMPYSSSCLLTAEIDFKGTLMTLRYSFGDNSVLD